MPNIIQIPSGSGKEQLFDVWCDPHNFSTEMPAMRICDIEQSVAYINVDKLKAAMLTYPGGYTGWSTFFKNCLSLKTLDLHSFPTAGTTDFSQCFQGCQSLETLNVTNWDVSSGTKFNSMFSYCISLTKLDLTGWNTSSATQMSSMFNSCNRLAKMWVPSTFVATSVTQAVYQPFSTGTGTTTHVYTDATDAVTQNWTSINNNFIIHYNSTYADYENA